MGAAATAGTSRPKNADRGVSCAMRAAPSWEELATEARETDAGGVKSESLERCQAKRS